ncbi:LANO_0H09934g1_1 [Lachancea nothofagi CBS 11611]|uniref:Transcription elongation factor 1 homolog n=1 Tax=Lachancea nothofagi CBS 11611 TaxID=1266666 RepID=A0A1G4KLX8_9SACH|nr:LANO_0H09934g1_1 [Lachancea nothofagi CBS 11611]
MGKRKKSSRGPAKKLTQRLDLNFNCLFCNHERSVTCTLDKKNSIGSLSCKVCGQSFQTHINALSQPVDVYSDWFDAVEEVNAGKVSDSEGDSDSASDYESDSDAEETNKRRAQVGSDAEELSEEEEAIGKRARGHIVDSEEDDDDDDDDE